ncbi:hypothetical protein KKG46_03855 [Patescibacteria group bacterium]|nr:hypothetical protein [Patescibacteria group bacterium]
MSMYLYLSETILSNVDDSDPNNTTYKLGCLTLKRDEDGRLIYHIRNDRSPLAMRIPIALKKHVIAVSMLRQIPDDPIRLLGIYEHRGARATVDVVHGGDSWLSVHIIGIEIEEVVKLYNLIRSGAIEPTESWERLQPGTEPEYIEDDDGLDITGWGSLRLHSRKDAPN